MACLVWEHLYTCFVCVYITGLYERHGSNSCTQSSRVCLMEKPVLSHIGCQVDQDAGHVLSNTQHTPTKCDWSLFVSFCGRSCSISLNNNIGQHWAILTIQNKIFNVQSDKLLFFVTHILYVCVYIYGYMGNMGHIYPYMLATSKARRKQSPRFPKTIWNWSRA